MKHLKLLVIAVLSLLTFASCNDDDDDNNNVTPTEEATIVVEVTTFNLNANADPNAFEVRDTEIEEDFASQQPGFLKRMSGVDANGKYVIMVFWETLADADASIAAFQADPTVADYFGMIDGNTFSAERYTTFEVPNIDFSLASKNVIEVTTFNLNAGVDANAFVARDAEIEQDFASQQPGFIRRTSGVDANGKYAVIVFWETLADADASIAAFGSDPTVADYFAMIDANTFSAERFAIFSPPLAEGLNITMRNTLQDPGEAEVTYPSLFGQADDAFDEFATLSNATVEFATALAQTGVPTPFGPLDVNGLYEINLTENSITYTVIAALTDPFWGPGGIADIFGVTPVGKTDRYYFTFSDAHNITGFTTDGTGVNLRIDSDNVVVVEIGEGFDVQPGASFSISLN